MFVSASCCGYRGGAAQPHANQPHANQPHATQAHATPAHAAGSDTADTIMQAIMKPMARGVNTAMKKPGLLQKLVDAVSSLIPLDKIKQALKTTLNPQYTRACGAVAPMMTNFGGVAGLKIIEFLQVLLLRISSI
jgi:hypothetical protein